MAFAFTLLYITISLLSPDALPIALQDIHILQVIAAVIILSSLPAFGKSRLLQLRETYFITALIFVAFGSIVATGWLGGAFIAVSGFVPFVATYFFIVVNCTTLKRLKILASVLFLAMSFNLVHGMIDEHNGVMLSGYLMRGSTLIRYRGLGVISDPNDLAQVLVTTTALLFMRWKKGAFTANFFLSILPAGFLCYGIYLTHSRGGLLALIATTLYGFKNRLGVVRSVILAGLLAASLVVFNATGGRNINDDDGDRIGLWSAALSTFKAHPIIGVGIQRFSEYSGNGLTAHNSFVLCLAELGIIGYLCWMGAIVTSWSGLAAVSAEPAAKAPEPESPLRMRPPNGPGSTLRAQQPVLNHRAGATVAKSPLTVRRPVDEQDRPTVDADEVRRASVVMRSAFVGVLVAGFFISRTYAITLYVVFGMSGALQAIYQRDTGETLPEVPILKRICIVTFASVAFIYLFVRFKGSH